MSKSSTKSKSRPNASKSQRENAKFQKAMLTAFGKSERMTYESPLGRK